MDIDVNRKTFQTEIEVDSKNQNSLYHLPSVVNFIALRETFLSEAPFIKRTNRSFWKKSIDSKQFKIILAITLNTVIDAISDIGTLNLSKLYNLDENPATEKMAISIAEILIKDKKGVKSQDIFFKKLPEIFCYMIINSLLSCAPKQSRLHNSTRFREILLDWLSELLLGIRLTNPHFDRNWIFDNATNVQITVINDESTQFSFNHLRRKPNSMSTTDEHENDDSQSDSGQLTDIFENVGSASSGFRLENSPLISIYMNIGRRPQDPRFLCVHPIKMNLSHLPNRPLSILNPEMIKKKGYFREKKLIEKQFVHTIKESQFNRREIIRSMKDEEFRLKNDLHKFRETYRIQMAMLNNKPVSKKEQISAVSFRKTN